MATVRSCGVPDCLNNDKAGRCMVTEIEVGRRLECLTFARDVALLRQELHERVRVLYAVSK